MTLPRRYILSVPGHIERMHHKALGSQADVIMFDLEDSVPLDAKMDARKKIVASLDHFDLVPAVTAVRINSLDTPFGYEDLLIMVEAVGHKIDSVVIPKVNDVADIHFVDRLLDGIEMKYGFTEPVGIEASIETARGLENISAIAAGSERIKSLIFGIADYQTSIGAGLTSISGHGDGKDDIYNGHRWDFAISRIVMAAKARGMMAIDAPYGNFRDAQGLARSAQLAYNLGCDGKWAIHPDQIATINHAFSPTQAEIERARMVIEAYKNTGGKKFGTVAVDGRMIDNATVRLAHSVWAKADQLNLIKN
jgi:malyl-CoA/(S)-citramalyl-CoA lyase